jgi:hypothetical protein
MEWRYAIAGLAAVGALWLWQRYRFRVACGRIARSIALMRHRSLRKTHYVPVDTRDPRDRKAQNVFADVARDLEGAGLKVLGDLLEQNDDGTVAGVVRWFRNDDGSVCGWFGIATHTPVMLLFSESAGGDYFMTGRGTPGLSLARPPNVHRQIVRWGDGAAAALQQHLALVGAQAHDLRRVETADDATALLARLRESTATWRAAQPQAALLEQDLHAILGNRYEQFAPGVRQALAAGPGA